MIDARSSMGCLPGLLLAALGVAPAAGQSSLDRWSEYARPRFADTPEAATTLLASPTRLDQIGRILVPVMLNGMGPFRFVLDTGASHSTIAPRTAVALGLTPAPDVLVPVNGITGADQLPAVAIERLQAGELVIQHTRLPVVAAPMLAGTDGILGAAGLVNEQILVDFRQNQVLVTRAHGPGAVADLMRIPARRVRGGLIMVRVLVGRIPTDTVIDTGSERTLGNLALRDALHAKRPDDPILMTTPVFGATSAVSSGAVAIAPVITLGSARIAHLAVVYGAFHIFKVWNLEARPALILGMDALGTLDALSIDFARGDFYVKSPDMGSGTVVRHVTAR
jgi:Aspartyl protease